MLSQFSVYWLGEFDAISTFPTGTLRDNFTAFEVECVISKGNEMLNSITNGDISGVELQ